MQCHATAAHDHWLPNELNNFCFRFEAVNRKSHVIIPSNPCDQNGLAVSLKFLSGTMAGKALLLILLFFQISFTNCSIFVCLILCEWICSFLSLRPKEVITICDCLSDELVLGT